MNYSQTSISGDSVSGFLPNWCNYFLYIILMLWICLPEPGFAQQQIVNHTLRSFPQDDGDPAYDEDGVRNGTVIWRGGAIHVVSVYSVFATSEFPNPILIIREGAIVKCARSFSTDGGITWAPSLNIESIGAYAGAGGFLRENVTILIEGATITDIRDDDVGGDTNGDGNASTPALGMTLRLSGSPRDIVKNSTIKYLSAIEGFGSMEFSGNTFKLFGKFTGEALNVSPKLNASPRFTGNTFERFDQGSTRFVALDLRGMTPIIENNTFRDTIDYVAILVGPRKVNIGGLVSIGPTSGTIVISNNRIETMQGISLSAGDGAGGFDGDSLYSKLVIRAEIRNNTMRAPRNIGRALELAFAAEATVSDNTISNYGNPVRFFFDPQSQAGNRTLCGLRINNNRFSLEGVSPSFSLGWFPPPTSPAAQSNVLIDMKNNDWGDPLGPLETDASDGRSNPRGRGLRIGSNNINYVPFIGAGAPPQSDIVRLTVSSPSTSTPLVPGSSVTLNSSIDFYDLVSAPTGQIVVLLRDADGVILNNPGTTVNVTSDNHTATIPPISFTVPTSSNVVLVEANLAPAGNVPAVRSNTVAYAVSLPPSSFQLSMVAPTLVRGNIDTVMMNMIYTLSSPNPGSIELDFKERRVGSGEVLTDYPLISLPALPGTNQTLTHKVTLNIPLRDAQLRVKGEVRLIASLKDDAGTVVGQRQVRLLSINENANRLTIESVEPRQSLGGGLSRGLGRNHFLTNDPNTYRTDIKYIYTISTRNITNWNNWTGPDKLLDGSGTVTRVTGTGISDANISTGTFRPVDILPSGLDEFPYANARKYRVIMRMLTAEQLVVAIDSFDVPILEPLATASRVVAAGASQIAFTPVTASLNFTANQTAGAVFAEEFDGQFEGASAMTRSLLKAQEYYWKFIPLNRYWSVYDTLKEGTFSATLSFTYDPATDFPSAPGFNEDSLVIAGFNPLSRELEALPSTLNKATHTVSTPYTKFFDIWVVASQSTILTAVPAEPDVIPNQFRLEQNYPNPFNPSTTIQYELQQKAFVTIVVFNLLGQEVATVVNEEKPAGNYQVIFETKNLASGMYLYRIQAGSFVETKKMVFLK